MKTIVFGPEIPRISFRQSPDGSISFNIENEFKINLIKKEQKNINWRDLLDLSNYELIRKILSFHDPDEVKFQKLTDAFFQLTDTEAEKIFFSNYVADCKANDLLDTPALIPQVWVNWLHYDSKDLTRAERARKEPFRVDFVIKDENVSEDLAVVEIDGSSHFSSMDVYTQHVRKDRWLRSQGWKVYRITNQEIEECEDFTHFFYEIFGTSPAGIPF